MRSRPAGVPSDDERAAATDPETEVTSSGTDQGDHKGEHTAPPSVSVSVSVTGDEAVAATTAAAIPTTISTSDHVPRRRVDGGSTPGDRASVTLATPMVSLQDYEAKWGVGGTPPVLYNDSDALMAAEVHHALMAPTRSDM